MKERAAFTLLEALVAVVLTVVLALLLLHLLGQTAGALDRSRAQLSAHEQTRALADALETDLRGAAVRAEPHRWLLLDLSEDDERVRLAFARPAPRTSDPRHSGAVAHVVYQWEKAARRVVRAEFHAARSTELADAAGGDAQGANAGANLARLSMLNPAYAEGPLEWLGAEVLQRRLSRARATPLLTEVARLEFHPVIDAKFQREHEVNSWEDHRKLPAAFRVRVSFHSRSEIVNRSDAPGTRTAEFLLTVPQADPPDE